MLAQLQNESRMCSGLPINVEQKLLIEIWADVLERIGNIMVTKKAKARKAAELLNEYTTTEAFKVPTFTLATFSWQESCTVANTNQNYYQNEIYVLQSDAFTQSESPHLVKRLPGHSELAPSTRKEKHRDDLSAFLHHIHSFAQ